MPEQSERDAKVEEVWRAFLTTGGHASLGRLFQPMFKTFRLTMGLLPKDPRCKFCYTPFQGAGAMLARLLFGREPSNLNPQFCNTCEQFARKHQGGAEVELAMLFADVRGSTTLAEKIRPSEFSQLINRFYKATTNVLIRTNALIGKLIGDEVVGIYVPGFAGPEYTRRAVEAARELLRVTGHADAGGPWIPVGAGVHAGVAFVGSVGSRDGVNDITALGDTVNIAARLASQAGPGEVLVSEEACVAAGLDTEGLEKRRLELKGRSEPVDVRVIRVASV